MAKEEPSQKKIIIDEDWKAEAQKEKEVLKKTEVDHQEQAQEEQQMQFPPAELSALISMLATQAYLAMGILGAEEEQHEPPDLAAAQFNIDLLAMIEEKTRGNTTEEEKRLLSGTLHQLRMVFVEMSK
jgi:hypothetical protein